MNVLVLNAGSSTLKFQLIATDLDADRRLVRGVVELALVALQPEGGERIFQEVALRDHRAAIDHVLSRIASDESGIDTIRALGYLESLELEATMIRPPASAVAVAGAIEAFVPLGADVDLAKLRDVLTKRAEKVRGAITSVDAKPANPGFLERTDPEVVLEERTRKTELAVELEMLERNVAGF